MRRPADALASILLIPRVTDSRWRMIQSISSVSTSSRRSTSPMFEPSRASACWLPIRGSACMACGEKLYTSRRANTSRVIFHTSSCSATSGNTNDPAPHSASHCVSATRSGDSRGKTRTILGICLENFPFYMKACAARRRGERETIEHICDGKLYVDGNLDICRSCASFILAYSARSSIALSLATWSVHKTVDPPALFKRREYRMTYGVLQKIERFH